MLNRMHRKRRPGRRIDGMVVYRMHVLVERRHVDEPMNAIEMRLVIEGQHKCERCKPNRVGGEGSPRSPTVRPGVEDQHFVGRPDRYARAKTADEIVNILRLKQEGFRLAVGWPNAVVLE